MTDEDAVKQAKQLVDAITNLSDQQTLIAGLLRDVVMKTLPSLRAEQQAALEPVMIAAAAARGFIVYGHDKCSVAHGTERTRPPPRPMERRGLAHAVRQTCRRAASCERERQTVFGV
jgi:hypothetical protein